MHSFLVDPMAFVPTEAPRGLGAPTAHSIALLIGRRLTRSRAGSGTNTRQILALSGVGTGVLSVVFQISALVGGCREECDRLVRAAEGTAVLALALLVAAAIA
ncbi:hypothetical protein H351_31215 (plasmid) [Rhodococcus erythropolis R138]|nr:hypothetical protein H351_31215 [Rhodococcus erythropolis R138]